MEPCVTIWIYVDGMRRRHVMTLAAAENLYRDLQIALAEQPLFQRHSAEDRIEVLVH